MSIFCKIGLPGFTVSLAIAASIFLAMILSMTMVDKVRHDLKFWGSNNFFFL